jgi:transposase
MYPRRYSTPRPWQALTPEELNALIPFVTRQGAGRPIFDIRARLDAVFWVVTSPHPWRCLPPEMGPADTAARQFRRWAHAGIWTRLLKAIAAPDCPPALKRLEHWICRAYRRALRILKLAGIVLARRLGLCSAVNAPFEMLPDPDLSEKLLPLIQRMIQKAIAAGGLPDRRVLEAAKSFHWLVGGRKRISKWLAPP